MVKTLLASDKRTYLIVLSRRKQDSILVFTDMAADYLDLAESDFAAGGNMCLLHKSQKDSLCMVILWLS